MNNTEFREFLARRHDGFWELLATSAGNAASVSKTIAGLQGAAFADGHRGPARTFSLVEQRIDALGAYQPSLIVELAAAWKRPAALGSDPMDEERDLLIAAWASAIRYLAPVAAVTVDELRTGIPAIRDEADVFFGPLELIPTSWSDLVAMFARGYLGWHKLRQLDRVKLNLGSVTPTRLDELLHIEGSGPQGLGCLRVLRGRETSLTADAATWLCSHLEHDAATNPKVASEAGFCIAAEIALCVRPQLRETLTRVAADAISSSGRPAEHARLAYVLLGTGWQTP